ncbi:hypothetical protein D3C81_2250970 [compost metagenome]
MLIIGINLQGSASIYGQVRLTEDHSVHRIVIRIRILGSPAQLAGASVSQGHKDLICRFYINGRTGFTMDVRIL